MMKKIWLAALAASLAAAFPARAEVFALPADDSANAAQKAFHNSMIPFCLNSRDDWEKGDLDLFWKRFRIRLADLEKSGAAKALEARDYMNNEAWYDKRLGACGVRPRPDGEGGYGLEPDFAFFRARPEVKDPAWQEFFALRDEVRIRSMDAYFDPVGENARKGLESVRGFMQKHPSFSAAGEAEELYAMLLMHLTAIGDNNTDKDAEVVRAGVKNFLAKDRGYPCYRLVEQGRLKFGDLYSACLRELRAKDLPKIEQRSQFGTVTRQIAHAKAAAGKVWPVQHEVVRINPKSEAANSGLMPGDRIVSINGKPLESVNDIRAAIWPLAPGTVVNVLVVRRGEEFWIPVKTSAP